MIRRLVTERDVAAGRVSSPLVLDEHTLLTPAARDRAAALGIEIVERGEHRPRAGAAERTPAVPVAPAAGSACGSGAGGASRDAPPAGAPAPCARCGGPCRGTGGTGCTGARSAEATACSAAGLVPGGVPDGLYLVRVHGGRAVSVLPATGPGRLVRGDG